MASWRLKEIEKNLFHSDDISAFILALATPLIIEHRGYPLLYPEDTLLSEKL